MKNAIRILAAAVCLCAYMGTVAAQQDPTVAWKTSLTDLEARLPHLSGAADTAGWRADAESLRASLAAFAALHPSPALIVPGPLPAEPLAPALAQQLAALRAAVEGAIRLSPGSAFNLGVTTVTVSANLAAPAPVADSLDQSGIRAANYVNIAKALDSLPGVSVQHLAGNRNEAGMTVRGFSSRGQVPLYLDDVPIYVPYDGYVDFNRFLASDIAELEVARGYTSPLLGPNALGGSINLVTKEPARKFDADLLTGTGSGDALLSSLRLGTRQRHFFAQGGVDWQQVRYVPLAGAFTVHQYTAVPQIAMTDRWNQSGSRDERFSGRLGWLARRSDQYVFSYSNQKGQKDVPLYQGANTAATFRNFWKWPYWNTNGYYFHSKTAIGDDSTLKLSLAPNC